MESQVLSDFKTYAAQGPLVYDTIRQDAKPQRTGDGWYTCYSSARKGRGYYYKETEARISKADMEISILT